MGSIGPWELVLILVVALFVFGPNKLPEVAKGLGKAVNEFKNASMGIQKQFQEALTEEAPTLVKEQSNEKET
ncbi:MAG: twin-arginine translocase TatA/TatE family subunit [Syntrophomonas sp.]